MLATAAELAKELTFEKLETCCICDGQEFESAYTREYLGASFHWVRCRACRLLFQSPRPSRKTLAAIYNSDFYWRGDQKSEDGHRMGYKAYEQEDALRLQLGQQRMKALIKYVPSGSHILDIGCATGFFLKCAKDFGLSGLGVELSEDLAKFGREQYGVEIEAADFDDFPLPDATFDAVTFWGCDSNFFHPRTLFERIHATLKPGGYVFFNFWDFDHPLRPLLLGDNKILYNSLFCFNRKNLATLLERTGFETVSIKGEWRRVTLESVLAWTGHTKLLGLCRRLGLLNLAVWLPALTGYVLLARKV